MFLRSLSLKQKSAFLFLANELIIADQKLDTSEKNLSNDLITEMNIDEKNLPEVKTRYDSISILNTSMSRIIALIELLGIAHIDGDYCEEERKYLSDLAESLKISKEKLLYLENWVLRQISLFNEVKLMFIEE